MIRLSKENMRWWAPPAVILFLVFLFMFIVFWFPNTFKDPSARIVTIPRGSSFKAAIDSLNSAGVIRSGFTFKVAGRLLGYTKSVKVGKYLFHSGVSNTSILQDFQDGKSRLILPVAIPEGRRIVAIGRRFSTELGVDSARFVSICRDSEYVQRQGFQVGTLEGYLMPETYKFYWQTDEKEIVDQMVDGFKQFYVDSLRKRQEELRMTMHEVLTLASIVEGESGIDEERPKIAGVYWNRLKKRMKLEADPTVQYVIPDGPRRLLNRDLKFKSPYNTYLNYGLPPGPINNPGKKAILAALYPDKHDYLYFVATGEGGHRFSKTYTEHQKAARAYRRVRREVEKQLKLSNGLTNKG